MDILLANPTRKVVEAAGNIGEIVKSKIFGSSTFANPWYVNTVSNTVIGDSQISLKCSGGRPVLLWIGGFNAKFSQEAISTAINGSMRLIRNASVIANPSLQISLGTGTFFQQPSSFWFIDENPPAGTNNYYLDANRTGSGNASDRYRFDNCVLYAMEL
ncbi:hypothetical protein AZI85_15195 [Bdellovibrio bacteriovorus]|uniref:Uncharacterized protein n=1 Tax=Bdellovibrio bacteriovorus TaxID=959 RepID=A0A150WUG4_BDEBC|nr:hypothetical protein [Bdellovibrio bacteriovorus]KYG70036.1 hypothetical protein AZI85_15195 [Bdellovibrio bacteriovorus]